MEKAIIKFAEGLIELLRAYRETLSLNTASIFYDQRAFTKIGKIIRALEELFD